MAMVILLMSASSASAVLALPPPLVAFILKWGNASGCHVLENVDGCCRRRGAKQV